MDVHVRGPVTKALRLRRIDVVTAQEDGTTELADDKLLQRATELGRILVSQDKDLLRVGTRLQREARAFSGIFYAPQRRVTIGRMVADLELIVGASSPEEWQDRIGRLPL